MPDWTYIPLRETAAGAAGGYDASRRKAMRFIRRVASLPGGEMFIRGFDYTHDHNAAQVELSGNSYPSPIGVAITKPGGDVDTVFRAMGYGFATAIDDRPDGTIVSSAISVEGLVADLDAGATLVIANEAVLTEGPATAQRVNEIIAQREHLINVAEPVQWLRPWTWEAWVWAMWLGIAMLCGGIGAAIIALGPVMLPYDEAFLEVSVDQIRQLNPKLIPFLQHDRITMAGCMTAIGLNDIGLALGIRRGWRWARAGFAIAGAVGFPTFFLFLGYKFFDPLHFAVAAGFFPLYLGGVFGRQSKPTWRVPIAVDETVRRQALNAQLVMVAVAIGVFLSGFVIMAVGLRDVLIPSDRVFLGDSQDVFAAALDGRLLRFIAHDRAGFGGALASLGAGLLTTSLWGWRAGEKSTWWCLVGASTVGFGAAIGVHFAVGYTDFFHLLPVYLGMAFLTHLLFRCKPWFFMDIDDAELVPQIRSGSTSN